MAITATERTQIIELIVTMFEAAPGATYLSQVVAMYEGNGHHLDALAGQLDDTAVYQGLNPSAQTLCAFTSELLTPLGLTNDRLATDFVASRWAAGESKGQIAFEAYQALEGVTAFASPQYLWALATLRNKETVAEYYSVTVLGAATDIQTLRDVIRDVDADHWPPIVIVGLADGAGPLVTIVGSAPIEPSGGP